jgi:hypothetical protein
VTDSLRPPVNRAWSIGPDHSSLRLLIGKVGNHLVNGLAIVGNFGCRQLGNRVIGELRQKSAISRGGPEFAHCEQDPVGSR